MESKALYLPTQNMEKRFFFFIKHKDPYYGVIGKKGCASSTMVLFTI